MTCPHCTKASTLYVGDHAYDWQCANCRRYFDGPPPEAPTPVQRPPAAVIDAIHRIRKRP